MSDLLTHIVVALNALANALGRWVLAPIAAMPGWLSATLVAAVTGVLLLVVFKYTSNQRAIKRVRDNMSANLLALKLFKHSASVTVRAQGKVLLGACHMFLLTLVPIAAMTLPVALILGQLSLWYQARPLHVGEEAVITVKLNGEVGSPMPDVHLVTAAAETTVGPVRVMGRREVCWEIQARDKGYSQLTFDVAGQAFEKELAVGDDFMRVSTERPEWSWFDALLFPMERPFAPHGPIRSIAIDYPERSSWTSGTNAWVVYWFVVSMITAFCFRRALKVSI
jgi:hypothetical protein